MWKIFFLTLFIAGSNAWAQFNTSHLHSPSGKQWVQVSNSDDNKVKPEDADDSFTFYSDGKATIDLGNNQALQNTPGTKGTPESRTNVWSVNGKVLQWSVFVNGQERIYQGVIYFLDQNKLIINLVEPGQDSPRVVVLVPKS